MSDFTDTPKTSFNRVSSNRNNSQNKSGLWILFTIIAVGLIIFGIFFFVIRKDNNSNANDSQNVENTITPEPSVEISIQRPPNDTTVVTPTTQPINPPTPTITKDFD